MFKTSEIFTTAYPNIQQQRYSYLLLTFFLIALGVGQTLHFSTIGFPLDDPFIYLHNAQVLYSGPDNNYVGVPALAGTTSIIFLALLASLMLIFKVISALQLLLWLSIIIYALGLMRLAFLFQANILMAWLSVITGLTASLVSYQLLNGVETGLALAIITWTLVLTNEPLQLRRTILLPILCGLMPFIRPELTLFSILLFCWHLYQLNQQSTEVKKKILLNFILLSLSIIPWLLWYKLNTGRFYPNTISAKHVFYADQNFPGNIKLHIALYNLYLFALSFNLICFFSSLFLLGFTAIGRIGLGFIIIFIAIFSYTFPDGLLHNAQRYLYVCFPILLYGIISCFNKKRPLRLIASFLLIILLAQTLIFFKIPLRIYLQNRQVYTHSTMKLTNWCIQHLPANAILLIHDAGYLSYATHFHLIDMVGLKTPAAMIWHKRFTFPSAGKLRNKAINEIALQFHPNYLVVAPDWNNNFHTVHDLQQSGWHTKLLYNSSNYQVYQLSR